MDFEKYLKGKGVDASRVFHLNEVKNCRHLFIEPCNFYSFKEHMKPESLDFIYSKRLINETKFYRILIKEWMNFCKVKGYIVIEMKPNKILSFSDLIEECKVLLQDKGKIIVKEKDIEKRTGTIVIEKTKPMLEKNDSIDRWSFGIITDGRREEITDDEIDSILNLKIPHLEIIICGPYNGRHKKIIKNIPFDLKLAWTTKKKNLICENAKYENLVVTHNRFLFDKNWYKGMKKYGNYFEVLSCEIKGPNGERADGWITFGQSLETKSLVGNHGFLEYRDWDNNGYIDGGLIIFKKSVWGKSPWDESRIWGQKEDLKLSKDFYDNGFVARFNPYSSATSIKERGKWITFKFDKTRFITLKDTPLFKKIKNKIRLFCEKNILKL